MTEDTSAGERWSATSPSLVRHLWLLWVIWLIFLWYPLTALFHTHPPLAHVVVVVAGATAFSAIYVWNVVTSLKRLRENLAVGSIRRALAPILAMAALALLLTVFVGQSWVELFIFVTVSYGPSLPARPALIGVGLTVLAAPIFGLLIGVTPTLAAQMMFQSAISGIAVIIVVRTIILDRELRLAREEIVRLAVSEERLRFARDLHDLLGHSLSLIALKTELVGKLIPVDPERARAENHDIEEAARAALREVRAAVAGYRQPALVEELQSARQILAAAGIEYQCEGETPAVAPAQEAVLSWALREGVTNVIKHSRAHHCTIRLTRENGSAGLEVADDGVGATTGTPGNGLRGLAERAAALGGRCEGGPAANGGFRMIVTLPLGHS